VWRFLKTLKIELSYNPAILLLIIRPHRTVGSGDLRQMSEYPIPHGGQLLFLHPEEIEACISAS
jgi:hypothetical protein